MPLPLWIALWISLALLVLSLTLGLVSCFRAGRALWRDVHSFSSALDGVIVAIADSVAGITQQSRGLETAAPRLEAAVASLRASWRRWSVLRAAVGDVRSSLAAAYPRK